MRKYPDGDAASSSSSSVDPLLALRTWRRDSSTTTSSPAPSSPASSNVSRRKRRVQRPTSPSPSPPPPPPEDVDPDDTGAPDHIARPVARRPVAGGVGDGGAVTLRPRQRTVPPPLPQFAPVSDRRVRRPVERYQAPADSVPRRPRLPPPSRRPRQRADVRGLRTVRSSWSSSFLSLSRKAIGTLCTGIVEDPDGDAASSSSSSVDPLLALRTWRRDSSTTTSSPAPSSPASSNVSRRKRRVQRPTSPSPSPPPPPPEDVDPDDTGAPDHIARPVARRPVAGGVGDGGAVTLRPRQRTVPPPLPQFAPVSDRRVRRPVERYQAPADSVPRRPRLPPPSRRPRQRADVRGLRTVRS
ncbi:serine/arginine repetitive matrix protein 1-like, partial [Uloborus diversus]|uniref:serine/arginine repetitive matrix protein 1-like n=1 Tax=Uloborus diversus TaxID=327109 RepID=UPI002409FFD6